MDIVTEGTRYAVELNAFDKLINRNAELLRQDPSNPTLKSDQARKIANRDECLNQIKNFSSRVAIHLYPIFHQNPAKPSLKQEPTDPVCNNWPSDPLNSVQNRFELLENQILENQQESVKTRQIQQQVIESLERQVNTQNEEISQLKQIIQKSTPSVPNKNSENNNVGDKSAIRQTSDSLELEEIRQAIRDISIHFDELQLKVITILTKEIPLNLQRSVRLIQQDVDSATHNALASGHQQITELMRDLISQFEPRIATLERLTSRARTTTDPPDSSKSNALIGRPSSNSPAPSSTNSKDPRILRRLSGLNSLPPESKSTLANETECFQQ